MEYTTYNIYASRNGQPDKVAELDVPSQGCWWGDVFIQGPDWPEMVRSEVGEGYAYRADLDVELTEEDNTEWDRITWRTATEELVHARIVPTPDHNVRHLRRRMVLSL